MLQSLDADLEDLAGVGKLGCARACDALGNCGCGLAARPSEACLHQQQCESVVLLKHARGSEIVGPGFGKRYAAACSLAVNSGQTPSP